MFSAVTQSSEASKPKTATTTNANVCKVCAAMSDGSHFGVESCRACAAFFRRSISLSRTYTCHDQATGTCKIYKGTRMCRKCRFDKCIKLGMIPEQVQNRPAEKEELPYISPSTSEVSVVEYSSVPMQVEDVAPLLSFINEKFRNFVSIQREAEYAVLDIKQPATANTEVPKERLANFTTMCRLARVFVPCFINFVQSAFPEVANLSHEELWKLYRAFSPALWIFESAFFTYRDFPPGIPKILFTHTTVIDLNNTQIFYENTAVAQYMDTLSNMLRECMINHLYLIDQIRELEPTEYEIAALLGCLHWDQNAAAGSPNLTQIANANRDKIFYELGEYYKFILNIPNSCVRIGKLMCIYSSLQNNAQHFKEELELYNIMNLFQADTFIYDFIKR